LQYQSNLNDKRTEVYQVYNRNDRVDFLFAPRDQKNNTVAYLGFIPVGDLICKVWYNARVEKNETKTGAKYLTIVHNKEHIVVPFGTMSKFPQRLYPEDLIRTVEKIQAREDYRAVEVLKRNYGAGNLRLTHSKVLENVIQDSFKDIKWILDDLFKKTICSSSRLQKLQRNPRHYFCNDIDTFRLSHQTRKSDIIRDYLINPLKHAFYSTRANKRFGEEEFEKIVGEGSLKRFRSKNPELHAVIHNYLDKYPRRAAWTFQSYLLLGGITAFMTGDASLSNWLLAAGLLDMGTSFFKYSWRGQPTGLIGSIRDLFDRPKDF
jgi:hypothetical protein